PYGTLHPGDMIAPALRVIGPLTVVLHHAFGTNRKQALAIEGIHFAVRAHHYVAVAKSKPREFRLIGLLLALLLRPALFLELLAGEILLLLLNRLPHLLQVGSVRK